MRSTEKIFCADVVAVLVTYNPDPAELRATLAAMAGQVADIYVVDNASANCSDDWLDFSDSASGTRLHLVRGEENLGLGAAHNIGIALARDGGARFVLLLDQDSQADPDMTGKLRAAWREVDGRGERVAAVGPRYRDADSGVLSRFVRLGILRFNHRGCAQGEQIIDADFIVSSGSLIAVETLDLIGPMDESLFIDHVDTEWCFRSKSKGLKIFGVCDAVMTHALGERRVGLRWFGRQRMIPLHKPFRYYYGVRNSVLLYRRGYMPLKWKAADAVRNIKVVVFLIWKAEQRMDCIRMIGAGLWDGIGGVTGKRVGA
ncbi:MAG: glycosyltransferase family 2 protein [Halothiobacillaceae bacterium]|nr:glycosyltransferase family 2 protein [Halothiobacillaceae bacterium]